MAQLLQLRDQQLNGRYTLLPLRDWRLGAVDPEHHQLPGELKRR